MRDSTQTAASNPHFLDFLVGLHQFVPDLHHHAKRHVGFLDRSQHRTAGSTSSPVTSCSTATSACCLQGVDLVDSLQQQVLEGGFVGPQRVLMEAGGAGAGDL